ncbi:hypothetical protein QQZ08_010349 [Neonectria magnoliae]|uniref:WLM domain-containing protein n=1 Tax=Neonectria magnoliae TaxID=2732573 RepID=A0ABR1HIB5_9HYPO
MGDSMSDTSEAWLTISVTHRKVNYDFTFHDDATITDLFNEIEASLDVPVNNQKILAPKCPLLKAPFKNPDMPLQDLKGKTLTLMGSPAAEVQAVQNMAERVAKRNAARIAHRTKARAAAKTVPRRKPEDSQYTFMQVRPLQGLPNPERSQTLLMRLKEDPGIRAAMRKHKFTVALLTEMEPLANTQSNHEGTSRILGLNRNQGEVIELRLRTDAHDGYRDYKTIRNTLCHELAHNVHGPHDRQFWDLCHQIEREVQAGDWKSGGHTVGESSHYTVSGEDEHEDEHEDHGGWTGGEFLLGGVRDPTAGMSRREILAEAALERQRRQVEAERKVLESADKRRRTDSPPHDENK